MPATVTEHYANHLAPIYAWMVGDMDVACAQADAFFAEIGLPDPSGDGLGVDLGCGHGVHSLPLAKRGYRVVAIDNSQLLLDQLKARSENLSIKIVYDNLSSFPRHVAVGSASIIVCMGDTLPHLGSASEVYTLIQNAARHLIPGGTFAISLRDYVTNELTGICRFIPVRADDSRIHTCFLDYQPDAVIVHDILYSRSEKGWAMSASSYTKLRLSIDEIVSAAKSCGLTAVHHSSNRGMIHLAFTAK